MSSPNLASVKEFNLYQNVVMVEDRDGNGKVSSEDKAYAQKDFEINVGGGKKEQFKAGQEVPFNRYQFLMKGYNDKAAKEWAKEEHGADRSVLQANESLRSHGIQVKKAAVRGPYESFEVYKNGQFEGRIIGEMGEQFGAAKLERAAAEVAGERGAAKPFTVTPEAAKVLAKHGYSVQDSGTNEQPTVTFHHKNSQKDFRFKFLTEDKVLCRAGEKPNTIDVISRHRNGSTTVETVDLKKIQLTEGRGAKSAAKPAAPRLGDLYRRPIAA